MKKRCSWVPEGNTLYEKYHDVEWGRPVHDDRVLFEFLILESAQAGLSWETVLKKRSGYQKAFVNFNVERVARFTKRDVAKLMKNAGIIRNRLKIESSISNAKLFMAHFPSMCGSGKVKMLKRFPPICKNAASSFSAPLSALPICKPSG